MSLAMGTSVGTITLIAPIAVSVAELGHHVSAFRLLPNLIYPFMLLISSLVFVFLVPEKKQAE